MTLFGRAGLLFGMLMVGLWGPVSVQAQVYYRCQDASGRSYISSKPCSGGPVYYGPVPEQQTYTPPPPSVGEAPRYLARMSPRCASLNDALRTGNARGLKAETLRDMRKEYEQQCREEESRAAREFEMDKRDKRRETDAAKDAARAAEQRQLSQSKQQMEMCGELRRILTQKRARTDLTEGEQRDLQRSEENYRQRCGG